MKRRFAIVMTLLTVTTGGLLLAQAPRSAEAQFKAAQQKEEVEGDLKGAIEEYRKIVAGAGTNRPLAARALVRMAECHQKLGDADAQKIYERVVRDYADQKEAAADARARLATLQSPAPAQASQTVRLVLTGQDAFGSVRGSPSPDGRYLTFLQIGGALAVRDLKEGTSRVLAKDDSGSFGQFDYSAFSADGRQVAYGWTLRAENGIRSELRILALSSGESAQPRIVHRNDETIRIRPFAWTPDAKQVLVLRSLKDGTNQIAMVSVQDGSVRVLKSLTWNYATMSLSPDGRYIAYDALSGDNTSPSEIFVLAADGSRETMVVQGPAGNGSPLWSPDGSRILFLSDRTGNISLWAVPIEQGKPNGPAELMKADIGRVRLQGITRGGTLYYLVSGVFRTNVYTAELDAAMKATKAPVLATERFINSNSAPTWSPDGQYLAYLSSRGRGAGGAAGSTVLVIRTVTTGEERDLPLPQAAVGNLAPSPRWFPNGRSLLVVGVVGKGAGYYRVDLASGHVELLHAPKGISENGGLGIFSISPDGKSVFYIASIDDHPPWVEKKLVRFDIDSRHETVLKSGGAFMSLALSPDGTQLASARPGREGGLIEVMPAAGGETRQVFLATGGVGLNTLAWSPDQRYLVFVRPGENASNVLWRVPVAGGEPEPMGISMTGQLKSPHVHPDGRRMTFGSFEIGASEVWTLENFLPARNATR